MSVEITQSWPYPQIFRNRIRTVVAEKSNIIEVDNTDFLLRGYAPLLHVDDETPENIVFNGSFTGNATGWTLGAGWAYGSNMVACTAGSADLSQTFVFESGGAYYIELIVKVTSGSLVVKAGTEASSSITADGKYRFKLTANGTTLTITPTAFTGYVDAVKVYAYSGSIADGTPWQFVDMGENYMLLNGATAVFKRSGFLHTVNSLTINTGCSWRGRVFLAGFDKNNFWNADWIDFWQSQMPDNYSYDLNDVDKNWVLWTSVLGGDLYSLFYPTLVTAGDRPLLWDYMERNEAGMMPMSWPERVYCVLPLGDGVAVFGQERITFLKFSPQHNSFGKVEVSTFGINSRCSAAGDEYVILFLASTGEFWLLTAGPKLERLGYKEYGKLLLTEDTIINYIPPHSGEGFGEWYIANSDYSFLLNKNGMNECSRGYTSAFLINGSIFGQWQGGAVSTMIAKSDAILWELPGKKTIQWVTVDYTDIDDLTVEVEYRNDKNPRTFSASVQRPVNRSGSVKIGISSEEFRIVLRGTVNANSTVNGVYAEIQHNDKRFVRGVSVNTTNS